MKRNHIYIIALSLFVVTTILFLTFFATGTGDVDNWIAIIERIRANPDDVFPCCLAYDCGVFYPATYPPGHFFPIYFAAKLLPAWFTPFVIFKLVLLAGYILASISFYFFILNTKPADSLHHFKKIDFTIIYFIAVSVLFNTLGLGYTDVLFFSPLILSFIFLNKGKSLRSGIFYGMSTLTKWQPLVLLPLIIIHLLKPQAQSLALSKAKLLYPLILFLVGLFIPFFALLPLNPNIFQSSIYSLVIGVGGDPILSSALNLQWIATYLYKLLFPQLFGSLENGTVVYLDALVVHIPRIIFVVPKVIFMAIYSMLLLKYYKIKSLRVDFAAFLKISFLASVSYYMVSSSVHENHLALAVLLGILLYIMQTSRINRLILSAAGTLNIISPVIFYGYNGNLVSRVWGRVDISIVIAFVSSILYVMAMRRVFLGGFLDNRHNGRTVGECNES